MSAPIKMTDVLTQECIDNENDGGEASEAYLVRNKSRNRPGMEKAAIMGTQKRMNFPNSERKGSGAASAMKGKGKAQKGKGDVYAVEVMTTMGENVIYHSNPYRHLGKLGKEKERQFDLSCCLIHRQ